ncbi:MAG: transpeptidase family protein [Sandaracinaceae bacterium]|jgi:cell division protein FtsI (penicillin-binding protein 3)|nr:transpeptidase family protein [Sandaracinaceae bacterium]
MRNLEAGRARWMKVRVVILACVLVAGAGAVVHRAYDLQVKRGPALREMAEEQYLRDIRLSPKRGTIYDRAGAELAVSVDVDSVWANPRELRRNGGNPIEIAQRLAALLGVDVATTTRRLSSDRFFVWIQRRITPSQAALVRDMHLPGVAMSREARRYYPNRDLAAHVLGFANVDGVGVEGLERSFEERLRGSVSAVPAIRDRHGSVVFSEQLLDDRAAQGEDLTLSIDKTIQMVAEQELAMAIRTSEARSGSVVVMEPSTGEILAIANYPTFNPNDPGTAEPTERRNRAITDRFEPGSTIKAFTIAGALASGAVSAEQTIDCEHGAMRVAEYTIHDSHPWDVMTPAQILARSSNIGTAKIGAAMGRANLFRVLRRFGMGEQTGLPLPGETAGILRNYRRWYDMDAATISFGQGLSVTTLQLAFGMGAIANGGRLMEPILVKRVTDGHGNIIEETLPRVRRQVIPAGTARLMSDMLTAVTGPGGTGVEAAIDGYLVAGKTGTAQKADYVLGGYADDAWTSSFVGFVPASHPRLVIAVVIDEPVIEHYGGLVAGPVFRRVGTAALRHLGVPADGSGDMLARRVEAARAEHVNSDRTVAAVAPVVAVEERAPAPGEVRVPDLGGQVARRALVTLARAELLVDIEGSGIVVSQSPSAGDVVARGSTVRIVLSPPTFHNDEPPPQTNEDDRTVAQADVIP